MKSVPGLSHLRIGSLFCIGRNYAKHAKEMGNNVPDRPMVFLKPSSSVIGDGNVIQLPRQSGEVHHEVELVVAIGKNGTKISPAEAPHYIAGYGIGIDVTARDIQQRAKERGHPWSIAKGFDTFAPISHFKPVSSSANFNDMKLELSVNGDRRQLGNTKDMIFPVNKLISCLSSIFTLHPGDLIFTGTPEGVSPVKSGDKITASLNDNEIALNILVEKE